MGIFSKRHHDTIAGAIVSIEDYSARREAAFKVAAVFRLDNKSFDAWLFLVKCEATSLDNPDDRERDEAYRAANKRHPLPISGVE